MSTNIFLLGVRGVESYWSRFSRAACTQNIGRSRVFSIDAGPTHQELFRRLAYACVTSASSLLGTYSTPARRADQPPRPQCGHLAGQVSLVHFFLVKKSKTRGC